MNKKTMIITACLTSAVALAYFYGMGENHSQPEQPERIQAPLISLPNETLSDSSSAIENVIEKESEKYGMGIFSKLPDRQKLFFPRLVDYGDLDQAIYEAWYKSPDDVHLNSLILRRCVQAPISDFCSLPISEPFLSVAQTDSLFKTLLALKELTLGNIAAFEKNISELESLEWNSEYQKSLHQTQLSILAPDGMIDTDATIPLLTEGTSSANLILSKCIEADIVDCSGIYQSMLNTPKGTWMNSEAQLALAYFDAKRADEDGREEALANFYNGAFWWSLALIESRECNAGNKEVPQEVLEGMLGYSNEQQQIAQQWIDAFPAHCTEF